MAISSDMPRKFIIMADYTAEILPVCIWTKDGGSCLDFWGFPDDLCRKSERWLKNYFEDESPPPGYTRESYNSEGRMIANEIKRLLGDGYSIIYRYISPTLDEESRFIWVEEIV